MPCTRTAATNRVVKKQRNYALRFDGVNDYTYADPFAVTAGGATYQARFMRLGDGSGGVPRIFKHGSQEVGLGNAGAGGIGNGRIGLGAWTNVSPKIKNNTWYELVVVYDGSNAYVYLDSVLIATEPRTLSTASAPLYLGYYSGDAGHILISDFRIFDSALTADEVEDLYYTGSTFNSLLLEYFTSDSDGSGTTLTDSVSGNDAGLAGPVWEDISTDTSLTTSRQSITPYIGSYEFKSAGVGTLDRQVFSGEFTIEVDFERLHPQSSGFMIGDQSSDIKIGIFSNAWFIRLTSGGADGSTTTETTKYNNWTKLTITRDASNICRMYLDGELAETLFSGAAQAGNFAFDLIGTTSVGQYWYGRIAAVRSWSRALSAEEIGTVPEDSLTLNLEVKTGLVSGDTWLDQSVNQNHAAMTGVTISGQSPTKARKAFGCNLIENGDFEIRPYTSAFTTTNTRWLDGTADGDSGKNVFKLQGRNNNSFEWGIDPDENNSLYLATTGTGSYLQIGTDSTGYTTPKGEGFAIKPATTYKLSCYMKTEYISGDATYGPYISMLEARQDGTNIGSEGFTDRSVKSTTDWTYYEDTFTTKTNAVRGHLEYRIYGHQGAGTLIIKAWFKDVKLIEV